MNDTSGNKINASTRLSRPVLARAERIANADHRTLANVIELCVVKYLPELEKEVLGDQFAGKTIAKRKQLATAT